MHIAATKPRSAIRLFALATASAACCALSAAQHTSEVFCGLGPTPGSAEFDQYQARRQSQQESLGYVLVCKSDLDRIAQSRHIELMGHARHRLAFQPLNLSRTTFANFIPLGEVPSHSLNAEAFALRRYFRLGEDRFISTLEWQMQKAGGAVHFHGSAKKIPVLGFGARLTRLQSPSGESYSSLSWIVEGVFLEVSVQAPNPSGVETAFVISLAESLTTARLAAAR